MNGLDVPDFGGADDLVDLEIAFSRLGRTDAIRFIGQLQIRAPPIRLAVNSDRFDPHFLARADYPQGNFSAVGNQNAVVHDG